MKSLSPKSAVKFVALVAAFAFIVLASAVSINAQREPRPGRPRDPSVPAPNRASVPTPPSVREREFTLRRMENERNKIPTPEQTKLALAQIAEDYERIQTINNKMMSAATSGQPLDYKGISDVTAEIRKRALRLKTNIGLPKPEEPEKSVKVETPETDAQFVNTLRMLDRALMSFVKSPIFKNPDLVDAKIVGKTTRDLENVIELSQTVSKNADKINKTATKP
jgi:hypothetical protein